MKQPKEKQTGKKTAIAYLVSVPSLILIFLIVVFPILYTGYISLTNMNTYHWFSFDIIGFRNYERALLVFDSGFLSALLMTVVWTAVNMALQLLIAFLISNLLNVKHLPLRNVYKTILMFPWAMPGYVSILLWKTGMFNSQFGLLTQWMEDLSGLTIRWLQNDVSAFICCTVVNLWLALPFMIMIMDGGLKSIDRSYYESATLDGAGPIRQAISITLPCLKPIIGPSVMITLFTTFKQFDVIYLMTQQVGSQTGAHIHTIITYAYENAFITNNYGYSSAISIMIFVLLILFAQVMNRKKKGANT
ncbi:MAG: sugar ABC transporter permease [Clostridia bacterium]|nr:sugar ABC transporter permease [Clostridia bacterium]